MRRTASRAAVIVGFVLAMSAATTAAQAATTSVTLGGGGQLQVYFDGTGDSTVVITQSGTTLTITGATLTQESVTSVAVSAVNQIFVQGDSSLPAARVARFVDMDVDLKDGLWAGSASGTIALDLDGRFDIGIVGDPASVTLGVPTTLSDDTTFACADVNSGCGMNFTSTINGPGALALNALNQSISFEAGVGTTTRLGALTIDAATTIIRQTIATRGTQTWNGTVRLQGTSSQQYLQFGGFTGTGNFLNDGNQVTVLTLVADGSSPGTLDFAGTFGHVDGRYPLSLGKSGPLTLRLSGASTYKGGTSIVGGTLVAANTSALGATSDDTTYTDGATHVASGATLEVAVAGTIAEPINVTGAGSSYASLRLSGAVATTLSTVALAGTTGIEVASGGTLTLPAVTAGTDRAVTKLGPGALSLPNAVAFTGAMTIASGTVTSGTATSLGSGLLRISGTGLLSLPAGVILTGNSGVELNGSTITHAVVGADRSSGLAMPVALGDAAGLQHLTLRGDISGAGHALVLDDILLDAVNVSDTYLDITAASVTSSSTLRATGNVRVAAATVALQSVLNEAAATLDVTVTSQTASTIAGTIGQASGGTGEITLLKQGAGTLALQAASTYAGDTEVIAGTLRVEHGSALGSAGGVTRVLTGATLDVRTAALAEQLVLGDGTTLRASHASAQTIADVHMSGAIAIDVTAPSAQLTSVTATSSTAITTSGTGILDVAASTGTIASVRVESGGLRPLSGTALGGGTVTVVAPGWLALPQDVDLSTPTGLELSGLRTLRATATGVGVSVPITLLDDSSIETTAQLVIDAAIAGADHTLTIDGPARVGQVAVDALTVTGALASDGPAITAATSLQLAALAVHSATTLTAPTGAITGAVDKVSGPAPTLTFAVASGGSGVGVTGAIGDVAIEKTASGALTLANANAMTADTWVRGGTLTISDASALGTGAAKLVGATTLRIGGSLAVANAVDLIGGTGGSCGTIAVGGASGTSFTASLGGANTLDCAATIDVGTSSELTLTGTTAAPSVDTLTKTGAGTLLLNGAGTFALDATAGVVRVGHPTPFSTNPARVRSGATLRVDAGITLDRALRIAGNGSDGRGALVGGSGTVLSGTTRFDADARIGVSGGGTMTISGSLAAGQDTGGSTTGVTFDAGAGGVVSFSGTSSYGGDTAIASGVLRIAGQYTGLGTGTGTVTVADGGQLQMMSGTLIVVSEVRIAGTGVNGEGAIYGYGTHAEIMGAVRLTADARIHVPWSSELSIAGALRDASGGPRLTKTGAGGMKLTSNGNAGYTGGVNVAAGYIEGTMPSVLGSGPLEIGSGGQVRLATSASLANSEIRLGSTGLSNDGGLRATGPDASISSPIVLTGAARIQSDDGTLRLNGAVSGGQALTLQGDGDAGGRVAINGGIDTISGLAVDLPTTFAAAVRTTGTQTYNAEVTIAGSSTVAAQTISGAAAIRGETGLVGGSLRLELAGTSSYGGTIGTGGGPLYVTKAGSGRLDIVGSTPTSLTIEAGTLGLGANQTLGAAWVTVGSAGTLSAAGTDLTALTQLSVNGGDVVSAAGVNTLGTVVVNGSGALRAEDGTTLDAAAVNGSGAALTLDTRTGVGGTISIDGAVTAGSVLANGVGEVAVAGTVTAPTQHYISEALVLGDNDVTLVADALTGTASIDASVAPATLQVDLAGTSTYDGVLGPGLSGRPRGLSVVKRGVGTWTLAGTSTLTGTVAVDGGLLLVDGALLDASLATARTGGALGGTGTVQAASATGGRIANFGGDVPRKLVVDGALTLDATSELVLGALRGGAPGVDYSQVAVTGTVTLGGAALVFTSPPNLPIGTTVTIIDNQGANPVAGRFADADQGAIVGGGGWQIDYAGGTGNDVTLRYVGYPPAVTGVTPASGPTAGGTTVTVTGTDFLAGATVAIGGVACTGVTIVDTATLTCVTGAATAGSAAVVVTDAVGRTGGGGVTFTYVAPAPVSVPVSGGSTGGGSAGAGGGGTSTATVRAAAPRVGADGTLTTTVTVSGAGRVAQSAVETRRGGIYCRASATARKAGTVTLRCRPTAAMRARLRSGALRLRLTTVFTVPGGAPVSAVRTVTVPRRR